MRLPWVNIQGGNKSNRIEYTWSSTGNFEIEFVVDYNKVRSYSTTGDYHRLDFDRITPIDETSTFIIKRTGFNPSVNITANPSTGTPPLHVAFVGSSTVPNITSWSWDYGDGSTGSGQTVNHTYYSVGSYTVKLTVSDGSNSYPSNDYIIGVFTDTGGDLTASFLADQTSGSSPLVVHFTDQTTGGTPTSWNWDIYPSTGFSYISSSSSSQNPTIQFNDAKTYWVNLTVSNSDGTDGTDRANA